MQKFRCRFLCLVSQSIDRPGKDAGFLFAVRDVFLVLFQLGVEPCQLCGVLVVLGITKAYPGGGQLRLPCFQLLNPVCKVYNVLIGDFGIFPDLPEACRLCCGFLLFLRELIHFLVYRIVRKAEITHYLSPALNQRIKLLFHLGRVSGGVCCSGGFHISLFGDKMI